jgi:hypothetical protein
MTQDNELSMNDLDAVCGGAGHESAVVRAMAYSAIMNSANNQDMQNAITNLQGINSAKIFLREQIASGM